jgi:hypothetical protein
MSANILPKWKINCLKKWTLSSVLDIHVRYSWFHEHKITRKHATQELQSKTSTWANLQENHFSHASGRYINLKQRSLRTGHKHRESRG